MSCKLSSIQCKLGQYFNWQGVKFNIKCLLRPKLFKPHYRVKTITDINFLAMKQNGIKYIVFDKDNTLTIPYAKEFYPDIVESIAQCKEVYGYDSIVILSNSTGSKDDVDWVEANEIVDSLGIKVMKHKYKKPNWVDDINKVFEVDGQPPSHHEVVVIGDRIAADIVMGNSGGFLTILTQPFCTKNENWFVTYSRWFEMNVLVKLSRSHNTFLMFDELKKKDKFKEFICSQPEKYILSCIRSQICFNICTIYSFLVFSYFIKIEFKIKENEQFKK